MSKPRFSLTSRGWWSIRLVHGARFAFGPYPSLAEAWRARFGVS